MLDCLKRASQLLRRMRVELIGLGLHRSPGTTEGPAAEALRDEALGAGLACRVEQNVGSARAELVGSRESPIEMTEVRGGREICHLVDDRVGLCRNHRSAH